MAGPRSRLEPAGQAAKAHGTRAADRDRQARARAPGFLSGPHHRGIGLALLLCPSLAAAWQEDGWVRPLLYEGCREYW